MKNKDIKAATVKSTDDTGNFRSAVVEALGKSQKVQAFSPYGLCSNPPDDSLAIAFNILGIAANTVAIIDDPKNRKKGLAKGEVAIVNYLTGTFIYLKENGGIDVEIEQGPFVNITPDGTINLNNASGSIVTMSPSGGVTVSAVSTTINSTTTDIISSVTNLTSSTSINLTAPLVTITAPIINTAGLFTNNGAIVATDFSTATIASLNAHGHAPGTLKDAESRSLTGKSGVPS